MNQLETEGWAIITTGLPGTLLQSLKDSVFSDAEPGQRCLLDHPNVREAACSLRSELATTGFLPATAPAIQAITFDKTSGTNWKISWHQDLMFPFKRAVASPGFSLASIKEGIHYARPPRGILENLLAVRLHLDACDETNGPLRVIPGSHRQGILRCSELPTGVPPEKEVTCLANAGEALLMRPLLLHASSPAMAPKHRRVLHIVYFSGQDSPEPWHRTV